MGKLNINNLIINSSTSYLKHVVNEWTLNKYDESDKELHCELCGTSKKNTLYLLI